MLFCDYNVINKLAQSYFVSSILILYKLHVEIFAYVHVDKNHSFEHNVFEVD